MASAGSTNVRRLPPSPDDRPESDEVTDEMPADPSVRATGLAADVSATRAAYVQACASFGQRERTRLQAAISARDDRLVQLGDEIRAVSRERTNDKRRLAAIETMLAADEDRFAREFGALIGLRGVRSVEVSDARIRVLSEAVVLEHEGSAFRIGEFAIDVDLERGVRISNISNTSRSTGWDHPHIQGTVPCLGNLQEGSEILLGQLEIVPLVSLLLQFLDTYNPSTAYGPISLWEPVLPASLGETASANGARA